MKIKENKIQEVVVGCSCDICGKTEQYDKFAEVHYCEEGMQGFRSISGVLDVCSFKCFEQALLRLDRNWASVIKIDYPKILQSTYKG